jgi:6-phosphofructokinase 1
MRRIAVLTSGGDAPGMNAAIRAVVRTGLARELEVYGVQNGYLGLLQGDFAPLGARDVGSILQRGGTFLGTARAPEFRTEEGIDKAVAALSRAGIEGIVVIGGGGSQTGSLALWKKGVPVVGVASTIDHDLVGSDPTVGVDTALNVALEAIDRLKVTASSHGRAFLVEVMGRDGGYLGLMAGIAGGAEAVCIPEVPVDPEAVAAQINDAYARKKAHALVVVAEGAAYDAAGLVRYFTKHHDRLGFAIRTTTLGHVQRGGAPTAFDRILAARLGSAAVAALDAGQSGVLCGLLGDRVLSTPLAEVVGRRKPLSPEMIELAHVLAR